MQLNVTLSDAKWHRDYAFNMMCYFADNGNYMREAESFAAFDRWDRAIQIEECKVCQANKGRMYPNHFASSNCKSGKYNHCTCDTCF